MGKLYHPVITMANTNFLLLNKQTYRLLDLKFQLKWIKSIETLLNLLTWYFEELPVLTEIFNEQQ